MTEQPATAESAPEATITGEPPNALAARFTGYGSPATGAFDVHLLPPEHWELGVVDEAGYFRRTGHALGDYCVSLQSLGVINTVSLSTVVSEIARDDECPSGLSDSLHRLTYSGTNGAFCVPVRIRSNYLFPLNNLYVQILNVTDGFAMYSGLDQTALGLGNGAMQPFFSGDGAPTGRLGLVRYPSLSERGDSATEWWIFQRPGDSDFVFEGVVVYSNAEKENDVDDDCDRRIDEDLSSYEHGDVCRTDLDCWSGHCDCSEPPCGADDSLVCQPAPR